MKRFLIAAMMLALAAPVAAQQLYKWVDKDGKTHYSDTPPANQETQAARASASGSPAPPRRPPKTAVERDKELEKGRQDSREAAKKSDDAAKLAAAQDEQCQRARQRATSTYADGGRIHKYNDKGERVLLERRGDRARAREGARRDMDEACKKS